MTRFPLVLDLETKHTFREVADPEKLGITVVAVYDYASQTSYAFLEKEIRGLFPLMENASYIIGFNVKSFDLPVLKPHYAGNIDHFPVFDILDDIREKLGRRLALNDVISATLGKKKSGHGLMAIDMYKEGRLDELKQYCSDDVTLTKEIFDYGVRHGEIYYQNERGRMPIRVEWAKYMEDAGKSETPLTLPF